MRRVFSLLTGRGQPGTTASGRRRRRYSLLTRRDKLVLGLMVGIPLTLDLVFIWGPTLASIGLSLTQWRGIQGINSNDWVGLGNFQKLWSSYPPFWEAFKHNILWFAALMFIATPIGMFFAILLDREIKGTRIYQSIFFLPVVLSLALVGIIWEMQYSQDYGFIDAVLRTVHLPTPDWFGDPSINLWAALVAASWSHVGYIMVLYLAGLKSVDPSLREAAAIDGANSVQTYTHVVFWVMMPINVVIVVITTIQSLRAFDLAYIINHGKNGLELLSVLITNTSLSEANLIGFGSAIATVLLVISLVPITAFLLRMNQDDQG
jgi:multiple sugar transport system permease protein/raffinose/stachyose/melibiose transport system permease protein